MKNYLELIRLSKPVGTYLLFFPCVFGIFLAFKTQSPYGSEGLLLKELIRPNFIIYYYLILFFIGAFLMRSSGCIINDLLDKNFDKNVERTKQRPIASGKISPKNAIIFLAFLLFLAFLVLIQFNNFTILLGLLSLLLVGTYPLMKRITYYPQIFLGITYNLGIIFASAAIIEKITIAHFILYLGAIIWTIIYDTAYGYQDKNDDLKIGIKSMAIKFGKNPQKVFFLLTFLLLSAFFICGYLANLSFVYYLLIILAVFKIFCLIKGCDFENPSSCQKFFLGNVNIGLIIILAFLFS